MIRKIINIISCVVIVFVVVSLSIGNKTTIVMNNSSMYYLNNEGISVVRRVYSENTINCDLTAVSNCINYLRRDGFIIDREVYTNSYFDVIMSKEDEIYRIKYTKDGDFTSIAKPYKNSATLLTYINEKKE